VGKMVRIMHGFITFEQLTMLLYHRLFFLLILSCSLARVMGQPRHQYIFTHIGTREGLASEDVKKVQQDGKGFIWIATMNGLQRYDGQRFVNFLHNANNKNTIPNNTVYSILTGKKDRLWVLCGENRVGYIDVNNLKFHEVPVRFNPDVLERAPSEFFSDEEGNIMLSLTKRAILTYNEAANEFSEKHNLFPFPPGWKPLRIYQDRYQKNYWLGCDSGLAKYNPARKTLSWRGHNADNDPIIKEYGPEEYVSQQFIDKFGRFWLYIWPPSRPGAVFYSYDPKTGIKKEYDQRSLYPEMKYVYHEFHNIEDQRDGTVWVMGENILAKMDSGKNEFDIIPNNMAGEFSIRYDYGRDIFEDREKNIWICTDKGLFRFNPCVQIFQVVTNRKPGRDTTYTPDVSDIVQIANGDILVNTWGSGLFAYDNSFNPVNRAFTTTGAKVGEGMNWCVMQRSNGDIWRGAQDGWIFITPAGTSTTLSLHPPAFENSTVRQMVEDKTGNIYLGSHRGHLVKWNKSSNTFSTIFNTSTIYGLYLDKKGDLWISTGGDGVYRMNTAKDSIVNHYTSKAPEGKRLMSIGSYNVVQYDDSIYMIASGGLNILNDRTGRINHFNTDRGLPANTVNNLVMDKLGWLWLTTDSRICRLRVQQPGYAVSVFNEEDGIPTSAFNISSATLLKDGRIAIGRVHDFILFDPKAIDNLDIHTIPDIEITGFAVMNRWLPMDSVHNLNEIDLRYDQNSINIEFSTLTYVAAFPISYKMEGLDKDWNNHLKANQAIYNYLPPGNYIFRVMARNVGGMSKETVLKISVRAPFWKTWWFYSCLALLAAGLFYWEDRERMRRKTALQTMRSNIAGNLHEEINQALNNINMLSEIARLKADKEPEQSKGFINEIHHKSHNMIIAMDDMLWSIDPANDSMAKTIDRIREFADALRHRHEVLINLQTDSKVITLKPDMKLRHEVMIIYKMALRMLVEEMKAPNTSINIDYVRSQLQLNLFAKHIKLQDNNNQVIKMMEEMKVRSRSINAILEFQSDEKGTAVILAVKV
jgi:ligand-binding sensor domain-containing protein